MQITLLPTITETGPKQMAIDHSLLLHTQQDQKPRLRFYFWQNPTISLGYFQDYSKFIDTYPDLKSLDIVRRITGGGAILHDKEITYSITIPAKSPLHSKPPIYLYTLIHQAIIEALSETFEIHNLTLRPKIKNHRNIKSEPEFCFARSAPTDIIAKQGKVVGSAQRRTKLALLQHGSIIYDSQFPQHPVLPLSKLLPQETFSQTTISKLCTQLASNIAKKLHANLITANFLPTELSTAEKLSPHYQSTNWTIHRIPPKPQED